MTVVDLMSRRLRRATLQVVPPPRAEPESDGIEATCYMPAAIHEGVPVSTLIAALAKAGLTITNGGPFTGLIIHRVGHDPHKPTPERPEAS